MDDESNELQDSENPEGEVAPEDDDGTDVQPDTVDAGQLKATNQKLYARLKKTEAENKALKAKVPKEPAPQQPNPSPAPTEDEWRQRIELKTDGYSAEEVDAIMQLGGPKAVGNPLVKEAIASLRRKAKSEAATPEDSAKSPVFKNYTKEQLAAMSSAEMEKILPHAN